MKALPASFAALALTACGTPETPPVIARPVVIRTVQADASNGLTAYSGEVRARHETDLAFRVGGKIIERAVNLGDRVRKGDVLARLDPADARLATAAGVSQVAAADADLALAKAEYERAHSLAEKKFISGTAVDTKKALWQAAEARLAQARAQSAVSGNQLGYTNLIADRSGVITAAPGESGQVVAAGQAVVRLADPSEREVLIHVPESRIAEIKLGQAGLVRPWHTPEATLAGTIREIAASADTATRTFAIRVAVAGIADQLPLGTTAAVAFPTNGNGTIKLPRTAVVQREGKPTVWVVGSDSKVTARAVATTAVGDEGVVLGAGLTPGDRVVVIGANALAAGMAVRAVDENSPPAFDARRR